MLSFSFASNTLSQETSEAHLTHNFIWPERFTHLRSKKKENRDRIKGTEVYCSFCLKKAVGVHSIRHFHFGALLIQNATNNCV